ncbi:MAG: hypothetical protein MRQ13_05670 [Candidatus Midichloria sp.]|nr:hypothetical protein [Candidatus Midichloria sp.]
MKIDEDENDIKPYKIQRRIFIEKNEGFELGNALKEWKVAFDSITQPNFYDVKRGEIELGEVEINRLYECSIMTREKEIKRIYGN